MIQLILLFFAISGLNPVYFAFSQINFNLGKCLEVWPGQGNTKQSAVCSILGLDGLAGANRFAKILKFFSNLKNLEKSQINESLHNLYQAALPLFDHIPKLSN